MFGTEFIPLDKFLHDRVSFDCGEESLNFFLKTQAAKHMKFGISKTMVMPCSHKNKNGTKDICAFYAVTPSSIERTSIPKTYAKKLPFYPVPVFLIAQLAVDKSFQNQNLGKITLIKALEFLNQVNEHMPAYAVIVDCVNPSVQKFYTKFGFQVLHEAKEKTRMFIPMKTVKELF